MKKLPFDLSRNPNLDKRLEELQNEETINVRIDEVYVYDDTLYMVIVVEGEQYDIKIKLNKNEL